MIKEKQLGGRTCQFQPADRDMVDSEMAKETQVEAQIMGENRPYDVAVGHEDVGSVLGASMTCSTAATARCCTSRSVSPPNGRAESDCVYQPRFAGSSAKSFQ